MLDTKIFRILYNFDIISCSGIMYYDRLYSMVCNSAIYQKSFNGTVNGIRSICLSCPPGLKEIRLHVLNL